MGLGHGAGIVRSGLVLYLDAANKKSYPGIGTVWTDLSGSGNNGTLVNGAAYNSTNNGSMVFDGTNDYVNCGNIIQGRTTFSAVSWINSTDLRAGSNGTYMNPSIFGTQHGSGISGDFALTLKNGYIGFYHELNSNGQINTTKLVSDGIWHMVSVTKTTLGVITLFVDSTEVYSGSGFTSSLRTTDLQFYNWELGRAYWYGEDASLLRYNGKISNHIFYNRALTATEIRQNFNTTRGRYGI